MECKQCGFLNPPDHNYCGQCGFHLANNDSREIHVREITPAFDSNSLPEAERRQLTILFCDLVGSSILSEKLDPEVLRDVMQDYRATCSAIVSKYQGHVAQYLGDGVMIYFGYPQAHEDDAIRAVMTAIEMTDRIGRISVDVTDAQKFSLSVRIGIHTGLVVVGGNDSDIDRNLAMGETPNITARIQGLAKQDCIYVSKATRRLLGNSFIDTSLGKFQLKGFSEPVELYHVSGVRDRNTALTNSKTIAGRSIVGRESDLKLLFEKIVDALDGYSQIVLLSGEAGMGKTSLVRMVCEHLEPYHYVVLETSGSPYYKNSYLYPVIDLLRTQLCLDDLDDESDKTARIREFLRGLPVDMDIALPVLANILSIDLEGLADQLPPAQKLKQATQDILIEILKAITGNNRIILVIEDLHWIDVSTTELLMKLCNSPQLGNIFILITSRNKFSGEWGKQDHITRIMLERLARDQAEEMLNLLCRQRRLPRRIKNEILDKTDGVPFFIEEFTNNLFTTIQPEEGCNYSSLILQAKIPSIPPTLQDLLMERLDLLGESKELAQLCAILGRDFHPQLLAQITDCDEVSLKRGIQRLIKSGLIIESRQPQGWLRFRHALLRDAAYNSVLKTTRQKYHQRVARLIRQNAPHTVEENPELLAHHCTQGGQLNEALPYWLMAGKLAMKHSAFFEAIYHLNQALTVFSRITDHPDPSALELSIQTLLGQAYMMTHGYAAPEVEQCFARATELCKNITDISNVFPALCGLWEYYVVRSDLNMAHDLALELGQLAEKSGQHGLVLESRRTLGTTLLWRGKLAEARQLLQDNSDWKNLKPHPRLQMSYCQDARVATLSNQGCVFWLSGNGDKALESAEQALRLAGHLQHPFSHAYALNFMCTLSQLNHDREATRHYATLQLNLCQTYDFSFWHAMGSMFLAWANANSRPLSDAIKDFDLALDAYDKSGSRIARSFFIAMYTSMLQEAGEIEKALAVIGNALQEITVTGEEFFMPELIRLKGELLLARDGSSPADAEAQFHKALILAHRQGSYALAYRAATGLAQILKRQGNRDSARLLVNEHLGHLRKTPNLSHANGPPS